MGSGRVIYDAGEQILIQIPNVWKTEDDPKPFLPRHANHLHPRQNTFFPFTPLEPELGYLTCFDQQDMSKHDSNKVGRAGTHTIFAVRII